MRRIVIPLLLLLTWCNAANAVITDDFNRAAIGANWEAAGGTIWAIESSTILKPVSTYSVTGSRRSESAFPNDQYSQVVTEFKTGAGDPTEGNGPACRMDSSGNCYYCYNNTTTILLYKRVAGTSTYLGDASSVISADTLTTLRVSATGTTIKAFVNGVEKISVTDSDLATGKPGVRALTGGSSLFPTFDDFESTDATTDTTRPQVIISRAPPRVPSLLDPRYWIRTENLIGIAP